MAAVGEEGYSLHGQKTGTSVYPGVYSAGAANFWSSINGTNVTSVDSW